MCEKLNNLVENFNKKSIKLLRLKTTYYAEAHRIEDIFIEESFKNEVFVKKYPKFQDYMEIKVPLFDFIDYIKFRDFYTVDETQIIMRLSNSALDYICKKCSSRKGLMVSPDKMREYLSKLPKKKVISYEDAYKVFKNIRKSRAKNSGSSPVVRVEPVYTDGELNNYTKNDLIKLCINLQKELKRALK